MTTKRNKIMPMIPDVKAAVQVLGGPTAVAEWLGIGQSAVSMWIIRGYVSGDSSLPVYRTLIERGYTRIAPDVFGYDDWSHTLMPRVRLRPRKAAKSRRAA